MSSPYANPTDEQPGAYHPLLLVAASAAAGIAVDRLCPLPAVVWWWGATAACLAWLALWRSRRELAGSLLLLAACGASAAAWHHDRWNLVRDDEIGRMLDETTRPIVVEGIAFNSPRWVPAPPRDPLRTIPKGEETQLMLAVTGVRDGRAWQPASGWAALDVDGNLTGVRAGDRLRVMAFGNRPQRPLNPGEFDYASFERSRRVWCRLRGPFPENVTFLARGSPLSSRLALSHVRERGTTILRRSISPRRATLAAAILLGTREQLDPERNEGFLVTGTIHVLSISGLHVGILALGFWTLMKTGLLPRRTALVIAMLLTFAYAVLTDFQPPVVRAMVLVVAMCLARLAGRQALGFNTLAAAGLVVLAYHPASLFLAGTQLSFLAVAVMILFAPLLMPQPIADPLDRLIAASRPWMVQGARGMAGIVWRVWLTGALIWIASLPIVWQQYNLISPVALAVNALIWIPITFALYFGFAALLLGAALAPLGDAFVPLAGTAGWLCDKNLQVIELCIAASRDWPGSYAWLPAPPGWWIGLFYVVLFLLAAFPPLRPSRGWWYVLPIVWFAVAYGLATPQAKAKPVATGDAPPLRCTFVAVGHGVACLLELPDGRTILYDAGRLGSPMAAVRPVSGVLWSRGIRHLDAIVISHADADHFNAVPELLSRFSVGAIYVSPVMFERPQPAALELRLAIEQSGVPLRAIHAGDRLQSSAELRMEVLHPPRKGVIGSDNANSVLLLVEYAGRRLLLSGDLEPPGLEDVLAEEPLDCDAILAPHHGSLRSDPTGFALWSTPELVVISGARNLENVANVESVKDSYRARGARVLHTAEDGCVCIELSEAGMTASTFRPQAASPPDP